MLFILKQLAFFIHKTGHASSVSALRMETSCTFMETNRHLFTRLRCKDATLAVVFPLFSGLFGSG
jgi:hypothetical protein